MRGGITNAARLVVFIKSFGLALPMIANDLKLKIRRRKNQKQRRLDYCCNSQPRNRTYLTRNRTISRRQFVQNSEVIKLR